MTKSHDSTKQQQQLECDDVAPSLFLSTTSTVPNASILFAILYARAFLSAACGKRFPWISRFRRPSVSLPYKLESDDVASSLFLFTTSTVPNASVLFDILYLGFHCPVRTALCTKAMMWYLLFFFPQQPLYQMLQFICILGHYF